MVDPAGDQQDRAVLPDRAGLLVQAREDDDLDRALQVLQGHDGHRRARPRHHGARADDDPADDEPLAVERLVREVAGVGGDEVAHLLGDLAHRVLREVQPEQLLLPAQPLADRRLGHVCGSGRSRTIDSAAPMSNSDVWPVARSRCVAGPGRDRVVQPLAGPAPGGRTR